MKCIKCQNSGTTGLKHLGPMCNKCFLRTIEKRVRKDLTTNKIFAPNDHILLINDKSVKAAICRYFLDSIKKDIPLDIHIKSIKTGEYDKIVTSANLDYEIESFLESLFTNKPYTQSKEVHLLRTVSDEEIITLKKILKLKGSVKKTKMGKILDKLEKQYPGSKFGLFKSSSRTSAV
ncbi:hypothetical protein GF358_01140 [Candidatus Woesearchaeota archaeon]|nr:hypothetical protein [Candidatus Woesearchaeota archaeon]